MKLDLANSLRRHSPFAAANPRTAAIAAVLVAVLPGGFLVPACYALYAAIRRSRGK